MEAPRIEYKDLKDREKGDSSDTIRERITKARKIQNKRYKDDGIYTNSQMTNKLVEKYCKLGVKEKEILEKAFDKYNLSARMYYKILKVARTLADIEGNENISEDNIIEAICYRTIDKKYW